MVGLSILLFRLVILFLLITWSKMGIYLTVGLISRKLSRKISLSPTIMRNTKIFRKICGLKFGIILVKNIVVRITSIIQKTMKSNIIKQWFGMNLCTWYFVWTLLILCTEIHGSVSKEELLSCWWKSRTVIRCLRNVEYQLSYLTRTQISHFLIIYWIKN